ncbi:hypothetical protein AXF42_Ash005161 [Apostasia shenzhenica]|uniref:RRM domain-containing protein n=1 Tax=Apostasia shenzhenica TaxID=1088818 RepID=A0A2I0B8P8_9ASPA|nr:hypothetical protein AXF42_Ash005161 [Apostasia shenzhenica]
MAGGGPPSAVDLLLFHRQERDFFNRLVNRLGQNPVPTQWVMALWLWFESIGHHDFIRHVSSYSDDVVLRFVFEANSCIRRLAGHSSANVHVEAPEELPLTNTLVAEPIGLRFFDYHRNLALDGVVYFFKNVAEIIFDDNIMAIAARDPSHPASRASWSPSASPSQLPPPARASPSSSYLNPMARPWFPASLHRPDEQRSMFITFSRGYPLTREEIKEFFNSRYGNCVETVMIERAPAGSPPMYGRVVFTSSRMIAAVLNGQRTAKFVINGRHLWARLYVPRHASN